MKIYSVTEVLGKYFDWRLIPDAVLALACQRGTDAHTGCSMYDQLGYVFSVPEAARGYVDSFIEWHKRNVFKTLLNEKRLNDKELGFTGRPDFVFELDTGEIVLVDIKTPLAESPTWKCQLAAYHHLVTEIGKIKLDDTMSLRLHPEGGPAKGKRYGSRRIEYFNYFLSALNSHRGIIG